MNIAQKIRGWRSRKHPRAVISQSCLNKIPVHLHSHFTEVAEEPTAQVAYSSQPDMFTMVMIAEDIVDGALDNMLIGGDEHTDLGLAQSPYEVAQGFGGLGDGNTGGGGAGSDYTPDPPQSQDYSSVPDTSSDSNSSYESSPSYDSSSSDSSSYSSSDSGSSYDSGSSADSGSSGGSDF